MSDEMGKSKVIIMGLIKIIKKLLEFSTFAWILTICVIYVAIKEWDVVLGFFAIFLFYITYNLFKPMFNLLQSCEEK